jgi:hypothetical protein
MVTTRRTLIILLVLELGLAAGVAAQGAGMGRRAGGHPARRFDPATVTTVSGTVASVETVPPAKGMGGGVHLMLKTATETIAVHLGPSWYLDRQPTKVAAGDAIDVKGSRVTVQGQPVIIAAEVRKGSAVLTLRDAAGVPRWSGGPRKSN